MANLALNKSSLSTEKKRQKSYEKFLPSLELKQKQLLAERKKLEARVVSLEQEIEACRQDVVQRLPMVAAENISLDGLVKVASLDITYENMLGTRLPKLREIHYQRVNYSFLVRPHWVDNLVIALEHVIRLKIEQRVSKARLRCIQSAVQTITQRVNLFSKVLLPHAEKNIQKIDVFLADQDRAAVVRSKLAKQKNQRGTA